MTARSHSLIFAQLGLWGLQLMLALAMLAHLSRTGDPALWWASALAAVLGAAMLLWYASQTYRLVLWRRRKSVRPSREVQIERRRMAAALHDGLGSQLVHAITLADTCKNPAVQQILEQCLLDLRLIADSMDSEGDPLPLRLARYRHRLQGVLEHRGITLHWDVWDPEDVGESGQLPRGAVAQHIMAIVQEAVSNILQHASAREIWITLAADASAPAEDSAVHASLRIEDDGRGLPDAWAEGADGHAASGMGLANMFRRAREIGARLDVLPRDGGGCVVNLRW